MNKSFFIAGLAFLTLGNIQAQTPEWENPEIFGINKEPTRATALPYSNEQQAIADVYSNSPYYQLLDGTWKFNWHKKPADKPEGFYKEGYDVSKWDNIQVPGNWELQGFGTPIYSGDIYPHPKNPPYIDHSDNPVGCYVRDFTISKEWDGRRVYLHFESGLAAMYIWVNGQKVGYSQVTKSPAEFDITPYIKQGKNTLAIEGYRWSDGSYLEDQDFWRLSGFDRSVYLYSTAQIRILDFFAKGDLDKSYKNGLFSVDVVTKTYNKGIHPLATTYNKGINPLAIEIKLLDADGKTVFNQTKNISVADNTAVGFAKTVSSPHLWSNETPYLYTLLILLKDEKGNTVEATSAKIGFRKVEIKNAQLLVNGKPILVRGVNLHEHNPYTGHVQNEETMRKDIALMKQNNINAVRTSHYPESVLWYKLCDEYGLFLVDEANLESHGMGYGKENVSNFPEWREAHLDRDIRLVERDKNHPSVIIWSLGNESSNGKAFFDLYDWIKARDNSRPVQYEQARENRNTDIVCPMYPSIDNMKKYAARTDVTRPYIMCEYSHGMGNSTGNFQEYFDIISTSPHMQGGFIWDWVDQGLAATDDSGRKYWAYGGNLGGYQYTHDQNFCANGLVTPDRKPHPGLYEVKKVYQDILFHAKDLEKGIITVENRFLYNDLKNYDFKWELIENGKKFADGKLNIAQAAGTIKDIQITLPVMSKEEEYFLNIFAYTKEATEMIPANHEIAREQFALSSLSPLSSSKTTQHIEIQKDDNNTIVLKAGDITLNFNKRSGSLDGYAYNNKRLLSFGPQPDFWRAPTDNDLGNRLPELANVWKQAGRNKTLDKFTVDKSEDGVTLTADYTLNDVSSPYTVRYTVAGNGTVKVNVSWKAGKKGLPELPRFGMQMVLPSEFDNFEYYGRGPWENYSDRNTSSFIGIYNSTVAEQAFDYIRPQENGNKTDVRWLTLTNKDGVGLKITGTQPLSVKVAHNPADDLDFGTTRKNTHPSDVTPRKDVYLNVDYLQRGVGGDDSWGALPHKRYRLLGDSYEYEYEISFAQNQADYGYLYCHMSGRGEFTAFALSRDGVHFHDLINGDAVYDTQKLSEIEGGARDAYICRAADGKGFVMTTTDMCNAKSKMWYNYGINLLKSDDLIHWTAVTFDFRKGASIFCDPESPDFYKDYSAIHRVWAPQIIWDENYVWNDGAKGGYMIYYSLLNSKEDKYDRVFYSYADKTFTKLTKPRLLIDWGYATIDADINYVAADGLYHLLIKKEGGKRGIFTASSKKLTGPYPPPDESDYVSFEGNKQCEGASAFQLTGDSTWRVAYVEYSSRPAKYRICKADKYLRNFHSPEDIQGVANPQHGSFVTLTKEEYQRLQNWSDEKTGKKTVEYPQVILSGDYPDPSILRDGKDFYMTHSPFYYAPGMLIWHSRDLFNWSPVARVLPEYEGSAMAPDLVKHNGKFYIYYPAAGTNWVIWADSIRGKWSKPVDLKVSGIDPGHIVGEDGKRYLYVDKGEIIGLTEDGLATTGEKRQVYEGWQYPKDWETECMCLESPKLNYHKGYFYLTSAQGGTAGPATSHMVVSARSKSVFGPWENSPYNPIVHTYSKEDDWWSKGHGTLVDDGNGNWWVVYHAYAKDFHTLGRQTLIEAIEWTEDGWFRTSMATRKTPQEYAAKMNLSDDFSGKTPDLQWTFWKENAADKIKMKENSLIVAGKGTTPADARKLLLTATDKNYSIQVKIATSNENIAGLILFYSEKAFAGIMADGKTITVYENADKFTQKINIFGKNIYLKIMNQQNVCNFLISKDGQKWETLAENVAVSAMNHNNFGGFYALRPTLVSAGKGDAKFSTFSYQKID